MVKILFITCFLTFSFIFANNPVSAHVVEDITVIHMDENGFKPSEVTINVGEKVAFENVGKYSHWPASNIHPTHIIYPEFDPKKPVLAGQTWTFTFEKAGAWKFHDHLYSEFTGTITVKEVEQSEKPKSLLEEVIDFFKGIFASKTQSDKKESHAYDSNISKEDKKMATDENALYSYVKKFGTKQSIEHLATFEGEGGFDCHQQAHSLGRFAYEIYGDKTFASCNATCHSGCYHGATEAFFKKNGTANLQANLKIICSGELNDFFTHQCMHGIGHGLMAWTDYEIHDALKDCDLLSGSHAKASCYSGVFMENVVGGLAAKDKDKVKESGKHYTKYLNDDLQYPCTVVADKYVEGCYFYQSSRMVQLLNGDFAKVAAACLDAPSKYHSQCFDSMGRDISGYFQRVPEKVIAVCSYAPVGSLRNSCLRGGVQDAFWDSSGKNIALHFCKILPNNSEKYTCYTMINQRATQLLSGSEREEFCRKEESGYMEQCLEMMKAS